MSWETLSANLRSLIREFLVIPAPEQVFTEADVDELFRSGCYYVPSGGFWNGR